MEKWDRQTDETPAAYRRFLKFRDAGPGRTVRNLFGNSGHVGRMASKHDWHARAAAWDEHLRKSRDRGTEWAEIRSGELAVKSRRDIEETEAELGLSILKWAKEQVKGGELPQGFAAVIKAASDLARRGMKMPLAVEEDKKETAADLFFETPADMAAAMPEGVVPALPPDAAIKPPIAGATEEDSATRYREMEKQRPL